jgi:hypothetical protein
VLYILISTLHDRMGRGFGGGSRPAADQRPAAALPASEPILGAPRLEGES